MSGKKRKMNLTKEEVEMVQKRNEAFKKRQELVNKRTSEINFNEGIRADHKDIIGIKILTVHTWAVNFVGDNLQKIQNFFNVAFVNQKNKFWYKNIFPKYKIPQEIPLTYKKDANGDYKFIIPEKEQIENEKDNN